MMTRSDIQRLNKITDFANQKQPEQELLLSMFESVTDENLPRIEYLTTSEIRSRIETSKHVRLSQQKLSMWLRKLQYKKKRVRLSEMSENPLNCYLVIDKTRNDYTDVKPVSYEKEDIPF